MAPSINKIRYKTDPLMTSNMTPSRGGASDPHIGELIRQELKRQGRTNIWLAAQLSCNPRTISKIFHKQYIDTYLLFRISKILEHDFFKVYSELL